MAHGRNAHQPIDVVIVDADPRQRRTLAGLISGRSIGRFAPRACATHAEALEGLRAGAIMIADIETIGGTGRLAEITQGGPRLIATSSASSLSMAVAAVRAGAVDFLPKPIGAKALLERLEAALATPLARTAPAPVSANHPDREEASFAGFIGRSPKMAEVYGQIRRIAPSRAPVFITGESGAGKEVCAEAIHASSGQAERPFVAINCSAIPKELMESEIFGHVRGAFTGAADNRRGAAELADGGTLFLDEIGEMDLGLQAKLLRFVQTGTLRPVGGSELKHVDVRLVSATNRDPFAEVEAGRFRADLFYRLHVLPIHLPPLRERREDILPIAEAFLARCSAEEGRAFVGFEAAAAESMLAYPWPGNIRQLQNVIRRIVVLHDTALVSAVMLPDAIGGGAGNLPATEASTGVPVRIEPFWEQERRIIETALAAFGGNIARAAAALELNPSTIYRKRQSWAENRRV